jgi:2-keto-4-pentenoate hydratase/2-oxohepta-3-ene-1,7-dioic acid hydratase in catechol pathway
MEALLKPSVVLIIAVLAGALLWAAPAADAQQRYVRYEQGGTASWGELEGETIHQLSAAPYLEGSSRTGTTAQMGSVRLLAPAEPSLVVMTALNFLSHLGGQQPAEYPGLFLVPPHSIANPGDPMYSYPDSDALNYEAEAVIMIGREAKNVPIDRAHEYIFGITAGNDGSERTWQLRQDEGQWSRGKGADTFNPVGPVLVAGVDPKNVTIVGRLNGEERQRENTSDMIFDFNFMVSYISHFFTLQPGDLIWSGTPGTTQAMNPGDVYEVELEGITVLRTPIVAAPAR